MSWNESDDEDIISGVRQAAEMVLQSTVARPDSLIIVVPEHDADGMPGSCECCSRLRRGGSSCGKYGCACCKAKERFWRYYVPCPKCGLPLGKAAVAARGTVEHQCSE